MVNNQCKVVCQSFRCETYKPCNPDLGDCKDSSWDPLWSGGSLRSSIGSSNEHHVLVADRRINCDSQEYFDMWLYANLCVMVYPVGIPLLVVVWLSRYR